MTVWMQEALSSRKYYIFIKIFSADQTARAYKDGLT